MPTKQSVVEGETALLPRIASSPVRGFAMTNKL